MKSKKTLVAIATVLAVAITASLALAHGGPGFGFGGGNPKKMEKFLTWKVNDTLDQLKATDAQRQKILAVKDRMLQQVRGTFGDRRETHEEVLSQWQSQQPDAGKLHALVDARADEMKRLGHAAVDAMIEVHRTLTPEQRKQLAEEMNDFHPRHGHGHGRE